MAPKASLLAARETAPWRLQFSIGGPRRLCVISHECRRVEPRAKQKAASNRKGVVGNKGSAMPTMPAARLARPNAIHIARSQNGLVRAIPPLRGPSFLVHT